MENPTALYRVADCYTQNSLNRLKRKQKCKNLLMYSLKPSHFFVKQPSPLPSLFNWRYRLLFANEPTDWHDNTPSQQIQQEARAKAKEQWREENGIYQANLTPQVNADMYRYVEQKQAEINRTWSK